MLYQVNLEELAINDILQLCEIIYGEGLWKNMFEKTLRLVKFTDKNVLLEETLDLSSIIITKNNFLGHYGDKYPWHTKTLDKLIEMLRTRGKTLKIEDRIILSDG